MKTLSLLIIALISFGCSSNTHQIFVGTGGQEGIFRIELDKKSGMLSKKYQKGDVKNPGFLAFSKNKKFLYTVAAENKIRAYKIESDQSLTFLNEADSSGKGPCHIETSKMNTSVVVANYGSGDTTVVSIDENGLLSSTPRHHEHKQLKASEATKRQMGPHAHNVFMSPDGKFVFVADLGLDKIVIYRFDENYENLTLNQPQFVEVPPGSGPRHFTFHPNNKFAYVINELSSTVSLFHYAGKGQLEIKQTLSTLPDNWDKGNSCADIHIHPSGKFLYGSNRGHNSIAIYDIDPNNGVLTLIGHESTKGNWPRNFALSPDGNFLLAANERSNDIQSFRIDKETGKLSYTGYALKISSPKCLKFFD